MTSTKLTYSNGALVLQTNNWWILEFDCSKRNFSFTVFTSISSTHRLIVLPYVICTNEINFLRSHLKTPPMSNTSSINAYNGSAIESFISISECAFVFSLSGTTPCRNKEMSSSPSRWPHGPQNGSVLVDSVVLLRNEKKKFLSFSVTLKSVILTSWTMLKMKI